MASDANTVAMSIQQRPPEWFSAVRSLFLFAACALFLSGGCVNRLSPRTVSIIPPVVQQALANDQFEIEAVARGSFEGNSLQVTSGRDHFRVRLLCVQVDPHVWSYGESFWEPIHRKAGHLRLGYYLVKDLRPGAKVKLRFERDNLLDKDGNLLAYVLREFEGLSDKHPYRKISFNCNVELVTLGFSPYHVRSGRPTETHDQFVNAERIARNSRLGIWSTPESTEKYTRLKSEWKRSLDKDAKTD